MSRVVKTPVEGKQPSCALRGRYTAKKERANKKFLKDIQEPDTSLDFTVYETSEDEEDEKSVVQTFLRTSHNFADYLLSRQYNLKQKKSIRADYPIRKIVGGRLFREFLLDVEAEDRVLCSQWMTHRKVIVGTACNKIMIYDVNNYEIEQLPVLGDPNPQHNICGIFSMKLNPSKYMLVTVSQHSNDLEIYHTPSMELLCTGPMKGKGYFTSFFWLDDMFFVSGSTANKLGIWKVDDDEITNKMITPKAAHKNKHDRPIRAITYNAPRREIATVGHSLVSLWDPITLKEITAIYQQLYTIAIRDGGGPYAIGSKSSFLLDPRTLHPVQDLSIGYIGTDVFSLSFQGDILTLSSNAGKVFFYDLRAGKYLPLNEKSDLISRVQGSKIMREGRVLVPQIFTHCYNHEGTRLFTAGSYQYGTGKWRYAALWQ